MTLKEFLESIPFGDIDQDVRSAPNTSGLYLIVNTVTWKAYIGQSRMIASRFLSHRSALRGNKHSNRSLQEDWNTYGEAIFRFCVFERMHKSLLYESETRLISSSVGSCYNHQMQAAQDLVTLTLNLPTGLHRRLKIACIADGVSMTAVMSELVLEWMERRKWPK